jgi:hypothetical protein
MMYSLIRTARKMNDLAVFFLMHWALYIIDGGRSIPFWMVAHCFTLFAKDLLGIAEKRVYAMMSEIHRLHPSWHFEFMYTHESLPRLTLTNVEQRQENDLLHSFVETRLNHEYPAQMTKDEKIIWKLSDNKSILLNRAQRNFITLTLSFLTLAMYGLWWQHMLGNIRYYFFVDLSLYLILMTGWDIKLIAYHGVFAIATFYLQFKLFNSSLQSDNIVIH